MNSNKKISIVLVDDSSVVRGVLARLLEPDPNIEVVGSVSNGAMAITMAKSKQPDIILLDVEMPVMDGLTAIPQILKESPETKIVMCSSLTAKGGDTTIKAMALGAVECIVKPSSAKNTGIGSEFHKYLIELIKNLGCSTSHKVQTAKAGKPSTVQTKQKPQNLQTSSFKLKDDNQVYKGKPKIVAIGSSTGGPQALFNVLKDLNNLEVPILITQHMPATFTKILAEHIQQHTGITAYEGQEGMVVEAGNVYVAQGGKHMLVEEDDDGLLKIKIDDGPQENYCKPAVDPMLRSLIGIYGKKILCVILTGMGHDGLAGAQALSEKGGKIIAQDENTSVVWGMPGAVATDGICSAVLPVDKIGSYIRTTVQ